MSALFAPVLFLLWTPEAAPEFAPRTIVASNPLYEDCLERVMNNIPDGRRYAQIWRGDGGGALALHCLAIADLAAGFPRLAAARLVELSERADAGDAEARAAILAQAAEAFLAAGETSEADGAIQAAFRLTPDGVDLQLVAAAVHAAAGRHQATINAVTAAEAGGATTSKGFVLRGRARFALADYRAAADDVIAALRLDPVNVDALVLRGDLAQRGIDIRADYSPALAQPSPR
jgi:tetratricopeptide (TPR) repeat protein